MAMIRVIVDPITGRQFSADSMDRFGDDKIELIGGYLSDEDKQSLECVSKQWRRVIYNKKKSITIFPRLRSSRLAHLSNRIEYDFNCERLKTLLNKCQNIREIEFWAEYLLRDVNLIKAIADYCQRLDSISIKLISWNQAIAIRLPKEVIDVFNDTVGPKIKRLVITGRPGYGRVVDDYSEQQLLAYCLNVESLDCTSLIVLMDRSIGFLPNLKTLRTYANADNVPLFADFVLKYGKHLKKVSLHLYSGEQRDYIEILNSISGLEAVTDLEIVFPINSLKVEKFNIESQMRQIGRKCRQLKRFSLDFNNTLIDVNIWQCFAEYQALESLLLKDIVILGITTRNLLMADIGLKENLKRIHVFGFRLPGQMFHNINKFVPNLKSFVISGSVGVADELIDSLSKLKQLKELSLNQGLNYSCAQLMITVTSIHKLLDNCSQLRYIGFGYYMVTNKTIHKLISIANSRHKIVFKSLFSTKIEPKNIPKNIPPNLKISFHHW